MSLVDAQQLYDILVKVDELLNGIQVKGNKAVAAAPNVEKAGLTVQQATRMLYRFNHLLAQMGLPEEYNAAIAKIQQMTFMLRMIEMSMRFILLSTPYGWAMGLMGLASVAVSLPDLGQ